METEQRIHVRIEPELKEQFHAMCNLNEETPSKVIRRMVKAFVAGKIVLQPEEKK